MTHSPPLSRRRHPRLPAALVLVGSALGAAVAAALLALFVLGASAYDAWLLGALLAASGTASLGVAYLGFYLAGRIRSGGLFIKLATANLLGVMVICVNVVATALMMFLSPHDLGLLLLLLLFAGALAVLLAFNLARAMTSALDSLVVGAERMARGDLGARVTLRTGDELETLTQAFNRMASELEAAAVRHRDLEHARRDLVATVSHDLRTPLASLQAMVEAVDDGVVSDPETLRRYHQTMLREVRGLGRLVDDLFELSQLDASVLRMHIQTASLHDLISDTLTAMGTQAKQHGVRLAGRIHGEIAPLPLDVARVQRLLYNVVQNALQHTPAEGTVLLEAEDAGSEVLIRVVDSGEGIPAAELPHVFERFYRGERSRDRAGGGAGLGLAIAKGIVEAHGGRIWAESAGTEGGTRVTILLQRQALLGDPAPHAG